MSAARERNRSGHESTDSGNGSGCDGNVLPTQPQSHNSLHSSNGIRRDLSSSSPVTPGEEHQPVAGLDVFIDHISYKVGDLGHVVPIHGDYNPEEGDCRYMAPELLSDDIDRDVLTKADIFSLGLTIYEAASLKKLPKNSLEDPSYERIKAGDLPHVEGYSKEFNSLLKV